ncbi:MAG: 23S rRNA (adenine(2503)-C(2))-methyltransferase RlmN [Deltaproteobacteria bacterium]|nr:23S rRNA (adenine(2503)-C(2))-methyltransferase RlmN [Deltaproteobacteria bacterium]MCB9786523.1 23S rRNA (adenine(2503)-C(2))-methyltransferase RlmN [Deltaproteobacteria bacterium]
MGTPPDTLGDMIEATTTEALAGRPDLKSLTRDELRAWMVEEAGEPAFRGDQVFRWLHARLARGFDGMSDLPQALRVRLGSAARIGGLELEDVRVAGDGTRKLLLRTEDGHRIESVIIPMQDGRLTQCVSSQVGCRIGCDFCYTARMPVRKNLAASEIADQVLRAVEVLGEGERIGNLVYMGMGEPLDNYDQVVRSIRILLDRQGQDFASRRITVSTSGVVSRIADLGRDVPVNLAVSLNASHDVQRSRLIPINKKWDIAQLMAALEAFPLPPRRRITVEYVLLREVNDTPEDARRLIAMLRGLRDRVKVNLIPFNPWPGAPYGRPEPASVDRFGATLRDARFNVTIRYSKGEDIGAACGQLDGEAVAA